MITPYHLEETYQNIKQHKLRSVLTGLGVTWGIMTLVVLLGVGEGFYKGVSRRFSQYAQNSVRVWAGQRAAGDQIMFTKPLIDKIPDTVKGISSVSPIVGGWESAHIAYKGEHYNQGEAKGVSASYGSICQLSLAQGRFLNQRDDRMVRPVCVIGKQLKRILFKNQDPVGQFISINGHYFRIVGTLSSSVFNKEEEKAALIPYTTFCKTFNRGTEFWNFCALLRKGAKEKVMNDGLRNYLATQLRFDLSNERAVWIFSQAKQAQDFDNLFHNIRIFLWIIGVCTLLGGMVGISNMMLVTVKERTQEIGIRKVLGASSYEIVTMILVEAIAVSAIAGVIGIVAGQCVIHIVNSTLAYMDPAGTWLVTQLEFKPYSTAIALVLLVVTGTIAGIVPAKRATAILPIKALNKE